jgi:hypothetical protein
VLAVACSPDQPGELWPNTLGLPKNWNAANAEVINAAGWIVGASRNTNRGGQIATLWRPQQDGGRGGGGCDPKSKGCK